jgi:hypothetical protein
VAQIIPAAPVQYSDVTRIQKMADQASFDALTSKLTNTLYLVPVAATSTTILNDTFTRTLTDQWGTPDTGPAWVTTGTAANFDVNGSAGTILHSVSSGFIVYTNVNATSQELLARWNYNAYPTAGNYILSFLLRFTNGAGYYRLKVQVNTGTTPLWLSLEKTSANTSNVLTQVGTTVTLTGRTYAANQNDWIRLQAIPSTSTAGTSNIRGRVWADGSTEPSTWDLDLTDNDAQLQTAAGVAVYSVANGTAAPLPVTASILDLSVTGS